LQQKGTQQKAAQQQIPAEGFGSGCSAGSCGWLSFPSSRARCGGLSFPSSRARGLQQKAAQQWAHAAQHTPPPRKQARNHACKAQSLDSSALTIASVLSIAEKPFCRA
jgi:hypothetical protein